MWEAFSWLASLFPDPETAPADAPLCMGGDLGPVRLLAAYSRGIFPCYGQDQPIFWWSPEPRCVLPLENFHLPRRSERRLRASAFTLTLDAAFGRVIRACALPRAGQSQGEGWITPEMISSYERLHALGYAHSVEAWQGEKLAGGLYGVALGRAFFGESMFHHVPEASRASLAGLVGLLRRRGALLLDCQQVSPHMQRMGAQGVPRNGFLQMLASALAPVAEDRPQDAGAAPNLCPWTPWKERYRFCGVCPDASPDAWLERS